MDNFTWFVVGFILSSLMFEMANYLAAKSNRLSIDGLSKVALKALEQRNEVQDELNKYKEKYGPL